MGNARQRRRKRSKARRDSGSPQQATAPAFGVVLAELPPESWKDEQTPINLVRVLRSKRYMVQVYKMNEKLVQLMCQRVSFRKIEDKATDTITWDELQRLKNEAGYADKSAIEIYPPQKYVMNSNARHLFVYLTNVPYFMMGAAEWTRDNQPEKKIIIP